ncbi:Coilin, partial [Cucurbita argyrosperma subsp. sororia]
MQWCLPQKGDVVAYRLIELSSTWTPEISSFRAGKVSWQGSLDSSKTMVNQENTSAKQSAESSIFAHSIGNANDTKQGNGKVTAWDEISEALSAKKAGTY